jgi:hypothetical protein
MARPGEPLVTRYARAGAIVQCSIDRCSFPAAHHFYEFLQILEVCSSSRTSVAMIKCGESVLAKSHLLGKWPLAMAHRMTAHLDLTSFL